ncbi:MAG TPA: heparinase II/III family protein [Abditibacteriaceae bacterium]|jgi:hypothetical protein
MPSDEKNGLSRRQLLQQSAAAAALALTPEVLRAAEKENDILASLSREHPRLIATSNTWQDLKKRRADDALLDGYLKRSEQEARALLNAPAVTYQKQGRRLLSVSRTALRRVLLLGLHFHLTSEAVFVERAKNEMLAAAAFDDWNPSHFLDTAEMTAALAFGYDWLYRQLDEASRQIIKTAIVEKGLKPGMVSDSWKRSENNWNQVCLAGLSLGALAIAESEPELARQTLEKTKTFNVNGLKPYMPDGVYPEGAMYWAYGTTFQTVLLSALQSALGTDWNLGQSPGFLQSAEALLHQLGPTGAYFNFADNVEKPGLEPAMWWFARTLKRPELLRYEMAQMKNYVASTKAPEPGTEANRLLPLAALWWSEPTATKTQLPLNWQGNGPNPLAIFRSDWDDPKAMYLALKGGKATVSHGHMDAGSFILEANGVRWACDLGMQNYHSLESKGISLWDGKQEGQRWQIFRLNNFSHNTLTINKQLHVANGAAIIKEFSAQNKSAVVDLSAVFAGQAAKVTRRFQFAPPEVLITDELEGLKAGDTVRWAMLTKAGIGLNGNEAILTQDGQKLRIQLQSPQPASFESISAEPPNEYDAPNPGYRFLIANFTAPESGKLQFSITLQTA